MSSADSKSTCLITGAAGFIGQALAAALLEDASISKLILTDIIEPPRPTKSDASSQTEVQCVRADLCDLGTCRDLFTTDIKWIYMLHGIMSGQAEANLDLGMRINIDSNRTLFDYLRHTNKGVTVVFTSSVAVYGPPPTPDFVFTESTAPNPGSSYGAQKHICETLLNDYSRRGILDARICRLPTVVVRPGKPTGAASSFASGIFREPLNGEQAILPVPQDLEIWICSPKTVVKNLLLARKIPSEHYRGRSRIVNLPGTTVSVKQMLAALKAVGGEKALSLVKEERDEGIQKIVESWPAKLNTDKANALGFVNDGPLEKTVKEHLEDHVRKTD